MDPNNKLLTVKELSEWLQIPEQRIYDLSHKNQKPKIKIGKTLRFEPQAIQEWLDRYEATC